MNLNLVNILRGIILEYEGEPAVPPKKRRGLFRRKEKVYTEPKHDEKIKYYNQKVFYKETKNVNPSNYYIYIKYQTPGFLEICNLEMSGKDECLKLSATWNKEGYYNLSLPQEQYVGGLTFKDFEGKSNGAWGSFKYKTTDDGKTWYDAEGYIY